MRSGRMAAVLLAALFVVAMAEKTAAQTQTQTQLFGWNLRGDVEAGLQGLPQNPNVPGGADGKFEEYRDFRGLGNDANSGLFLQNLQLRLFRPDEAYSIELSGKNWGFATQEFHLLGERLGQWQVGFDWDQMRHIYSSDSQTLLKAFGDNVFIVRGNSNGRPPIFNWNSAPGWSCSQASIPFGSSDCDGQISQQWYTGRLYFKVSPSPNLDITSEVTRIFKDGQRPFGMAFSSPGGNFLELVQPISQTIYNWKSLVTWAQEKFQLQGSYTLSVFVNDFPWVRADNPCNGNGVSPPLPPAAGTTGCPAVGATGQFGTTSLPPNNQAHTVNLAGGVNLPMQTRINSSFTYQWRLQNQDFLRQTYSNGLVGNNLSLQNPQNSLQGNVQTLLFNLDATSRPIAAPVTFALKYRLYDYMDFSDTIRFQAFIINDQNTITNTPLTAGRASFLRQNADLSARYQIAQPAAWTVGVGYEGWNRNEQWEVGHTDELLAKSSFDYTPTDWLQSRSSFSAGYRRMDGYNRNAYWEANQNQPSDFVGSGSQLAEMRKFNLADRNQYILSQLFQITPIDSVAITPSASYKNTQYIASGLTQNGIWYNTAQLGLQTVISWTAGMDVSWTPTDRLNLSAGYVFESIFQKQRNRNNAPNDPSMDWVSDSTDQFNTYTASMKATIIPNKLTFNTGAVYSQSLGRVQQYSPNATGSAVYSANQPNDVTWRWPAFYDQFARLDASFDYQFAKAWTAKLFYAYESFANANWQTGPLVPVQPNTTGSVFLGQHWQDYVAQIVGVTLKYKFE